MVSPLSFIYAKLSDLRNARFDSGRSPSFDLGARTVSVGNITTGGTGKTPLVILIAEKLAARGERVCILTRGYGRANPGRRIVVSDGLRIVADVRSGGDEPVEMARSLLGKAIVIADSDRVSAGIWAKEKFAITTFVLDDGFQHRRARRDVDIVCIDAMNPFGGGRVLPSGRLREPLANLGRASIVVLSRADLAPNIDEIQADIRMYNADCPIFSARSKFVEMTDISDFLDPKGAVEGSLKNTDPVALPDGRGYAFCALGNPRAFFGQLDRDNFNLAGTHHFRDHFVYRQRDAAELTQKAHSSGASYLVTTAKDAVKLSGLEFGMPCYVLEGHVIIDDDERFTALL